MFIIYIPKMIETILQPGRGIGAIVDVSQRAVEPNFPTRTAYRILGLLAMEIAGCALGSWKACEVHEAGMTGKQGETQSEVPSGTQHRAASWIPLDDRPPCPSPSGRDM